MPPIRVVQLIYFISLCILVIDCSNSVIKHRIKRKIIFSKSSKFFFRLNGRNDVLEYTSILLHGYAIRINYDLPDTLPKRRIFFKRSIESEIENLTEKSEIGTFPCVMRKLCEMIERFRNSQNCGMFCNIGNIISRSRASEANFFLSFLEKCENYNDGCLASPKDPYLSNFD